MLLNHHFPVIVFSFINFLFIWLFTVCYHNNREVKIDVYGRPVTANAKLQVGFSGEVLAVRN